MCLVQRRKHPLIAIIDNSQMFSCRIPIFVSESPLHKMTVVREKTTCTSANEAQYYSAKLVKLSPVCSWCSAPEETLDHNECVTELHFNVSSRSLHPFAFGVLAKANSPIHHILTTWQNTIQ